VDVGVDVRPSTDGNRVALGDRAVLFGNAGRDAKGIAVEEAASWAGTIPYEPLTRVGRRVPRRDV
jgi:alanine racemase